MLSSPDTMPIVAGIFKRASWSREDPTITKCFISGELSAARGRWSLYQGTEQSHDYGDAGRGEEYGGMTITNPH